MIKAVVFDLDDTLAPEKLYVRSGYCAVAEHLSMGKLKGKDKTELEKTLWRLFLEDSKQVFNRLFDFYQVPYDKEDILRLVELYRAHKPLEAIYRYYDDTFMTLVSLKEAGYKLAILSDGFFEAQENKLISLGIRKEADFIFDSIILTAQYGEDYVKPSEKGFLLLADKLGVLPEEMVYVGDNPKKDFFVRKSIPIKTVRVMREDGVYYDADYREGVKENLRIDSLYELVDVLCNGTDE